MRDSVEQFVFGRVHYARMLAGNEAVSARAADSQPLLGGMLNHAGSATNGSVSPRSRCILRRALYLSSALTCLWIAEAAGGTSLGVKAGANFGSFSGSGDPGGRIGFIAGIVLVQDVNGWVAFRPELLYVQKGAKQDGWIEGVEGLGIVRLSYIEVPLLASFILPFESKNGMTFTVCAGPAIAMNLSATFEVIDHPPEFDIENVRSTDLGGVLGADLNLPMGSGLLELDVRYTMGWWSIRDTPDATVKNRGTALSLGYRHPIGGNGQ